MKPARWTKVNVAFFGGVNAWCALYLESERQIAAIAVVILAWLTWLAPNETPADDTEDAAHLRRESSGNTPQGAASGHSTP